MLFLFCIHAARKIFHRPTLIFSYPSHLLSYRLLLHSIVQKSILLKTLFMFIFHLTIESDDLHNALNVGITHPPELMLSYFWLFYPFEQTWVLIEKHWYNWHIYGNASTICNPSLFEVFIPQSPLDIFNLQAWSITYLIHQIAFI